MQVSSVQPLPSLQVTAVPAPQVPPAHLSPVVQALPSSHTAVLLVCWQPAKGSQVSVVHRLVSLQFRLPPPAQRPAVQVSPVVQALPSSQVPVLGVLTQPVRALHESVVQELLSLQLMAVPATQTPAAHLSLAVQALLSSQGAVLLAWAQPVLGLQESVVHRLVSSQDTVVPPPQAPAEHFSPVVQALPSLQVAVLARF